MFLFANVVIGVLLILAFAWYRKFRQQWKILPEIPGPKPIFFLGNALDFPNPRDFIPKFMKWKEEYGEIVKLHPGPDTIYLVSDVKLLTKLFTDHTLTRKANVYKYIMPWLGTGLVTSAGEKWRARRKIITPTFHFKILEQFVDVFHSNCDVLIKLLEKEVGKDTVNIYPYINMWALDVICQSSMGVNVNAQTSPDSDYVSSVRTMLMMLIDQTFSAFKRFDTFFYFTKEYQDQKRALKILHGFTDSVIRARRAELLKGKECDRNGEVGQNVSPGEAKTNKKMAFLDQLLQASNDGQPLSDLDIREEVDTFMFAGHHTISSSTSFASYVIANHPEIQAKILEEQYAIFKDDRKKPATYSELQEMRYLEMVLKEAWRMFPAVAMVGKQTIKEIKHGKYTLGERSNVIIFLYGVMNDPKNFPDPERFDPERFSPENCGARDIFSYVPFSAGSRNCMGQKYAMLEMKTFFSNVLRRYEFLPAIPHQELQIAMEGILNSENGFPVRIKDRG